MPTIDLIREFHFEASHSLPWHPGKCRHLHGHSYRLLVTISGVLNEHGIVMDFAEIKTIVQEMVVDRLDHSHLNEVIENPTAENVALWIWNRLEPKLPLTEIKLGETHKCMVTIHNRK